MAAKAARYSQGTRVLPFTVDKGKRLIFRYDRKIPDYFSVAGAP